MSLVTRDPRNHYDFQLTKEFERVSDFNDVLSHWGDTERRIVVKQNRNTGKFAAFTNGEMCQHEYDPTPGDNWGAVDLFEQRARENV